MDLETLRGAVQSQLRRPHPPLTTLEILNERNDEEFWERYLAYFLDPSAPHGFETDVLIAVLRALAEAPNSTIRRPRTDLNQSQVETQASTETGAADILIWDDNKWFILIELNIRAGESNNQTARYAS